mmetsp:Transcript_30570/g.79246  ORF Transcript_30570/g.79246 Transcript_30570/m.79246 type:complete len:89 (+) Transcript_30570:933-1199(+)
MQVATSCRGSAPVHQQRCWIMGLHERREFCAGSSRDSFCPQYWYILHGVFCLTMLTLEFPSLPSMVPFSFPACFVGQTLLLKELSEPE